MLNHADFEFILSIAALPLSMLLLIEGHLAAKHESKWMMASFLVGLIAGCGYFSYKACDGCRVKCSRLIFHVACDHHYTP